MADNHFIADTFRYGRELVHAGIEGIRAGDRLTSRTSHVRVTRSAGQSLLAAAVASSVALFAYKLKKKQNHRITPVLACGAVAFCADFLWRTGGTTPKIIECAEREIEKVRDQHWLNAHPIDYA